MILFLITIFCAFWFKREIYAFPIKINRQLYQDMHSIFSLPFTEEQLLKKSQLQPVNHYFPNLFFVIYPIIYLLFSDVEFTILFISFLLIYLSFLDYFYYLTDSNYVAKIFILSIFHLFYFDSQNLYENIQCTLFTLLFFSLFIPITHWLFKKEVIGLGDIILLVAISPLFNLEQVLLLLLIASLSGLLFASGYFLIKKRKLIKLPFIPFISIAIFYLFITKYLIGDMPYALQ